MGVENVRKKRHFLKSFYEWASTKSKIPEIGQPKSGIPEMGQPKSGIPEMGQPISGIPEMGQPIPGESTQYTFGHLINPKFI